MMQTRIPNDVAEVIERLQGQESLDWEIKAARGGLPNSIWETISACANTHGGWLILGIAERDGTPVIEGVADPKAMVQQLHDQMRTAKKISYPVCGAKDISTLVVGKAVIVVLRVPPAPRGVRPVYTRDHPYSGTYLRRNEGDYPASRPEVDRMMREASDLAADQVILDGYSWDDLDRPTLARYRRRYQNAQPDSPHNALSDDDFLAVIGGLRHEHETGRHGITVAGLLMFGKDLAIRSWRGRHLIDFRLFTAEAPQRPPTDWSDRVVWEGNLLGAYDDIFRRLFDGLPVPFAVVDGVRVDDTDQRRAIREAFVNLLVHTDYREQAASLIVRSTEGFFLRNPGNSRVPDLDPAQGDRSDPRNPELVRMFRFINLAEEAGSGVPRMVRAWRGLGYEAPTFDLGEDRYEFSATLRFAHLLSEDDRDWLQACGEPLTEDEQLALVIARHDGNVDNAALRQVTGHHLVEATRVLGGLRDRGVLVMLGAKRGARYELGVRLRHLAGQPSTSDLSPSTGDLASSTGDLSPSTHDLTPSTHDLTPSTHDLAASSADAGPTTRQQLITIARPVTERGRLDASERDAVIIQLCAVQPLSLSELVTLLHRTPTYLRMILASLIRDGRLVFLYPDRPQHPHQRYIAVAAMQECRKEDAQPECETE